MSKVNFSDEFKQDAVRQITERGYPVSEVSKRLGVSPHSLYAWKKKFSRSSGSGAEDQAAEIRRLKKELTRITEERDILKKPPRISPEMQNEVRVCRRASSPVSRAHDVSLPTHSSQRFLCLAEDTLEQARP